jgi:two-component system cell cycle response regulator CpdR
MCTKTIQELNLDGQGHLLLIVEDDKTLQEALWNLFESYNFQVILAGNGRSGFEIIKQIGDRISFVISDIVMPKMGGIELFNRTQELYPEKKFILITGHPEKVKNFSNKQDPNFYLLLKPFSMLDILTLAQDVWDHSNSVLK